MHKILLPFFALVLIAVACQRPAKKKAFDYNQRLSGISDSLASKGTLLGTELKTAIQRRDFTNLTAFKNDFGRYIDDRIKELNSMEDIGGSGNLKNAMIQFLKYEKEMVSDGIAPYESMDANTTDEEIQTASAAFIRRTEDEKIFLKKVQDAQREYAKMNGFEIREKQ